VSGSNHTIKEINSIRIVGTIHISKKSQDLIKDIIEEWKPDVIMLELDELRMEAFDPDKLKKSLLVDEEINLDLDEIEDDDTNEDFDEDEGEDELWDEDELDGMGGFGLLKEIEKLQSDISKVMGESVGEEMRVAIEYGKLHNIPVIPIDKPLSEIAAELQDKLTPKRKRELKIQLESEEIEEDIREEFEDLVEKIQTPEGLDEFMEDVKSEFPEMVETLISDRNKFMALQITSHAKEHPKEKILVIVGLGHLQDLYEQVKANL